MTALTRRAAAGIIAPYLGVTPDSTKGANWRATVGYGYPFAVEEPEVVVRNRGGWLEEPRRRRRPSWQIRDEEKRRLMEALEDAYARAVGEVPAKELIEIVRPAVKGRVLKGRPPAPKRVDFEVIARSEELSRRLLKLAQAHANEDEAIMLLLDLYPRAALGEEEAALLLLM